MGGLDLYTISVKALMYLKILEVKIKHFFFFIKRPILFNGGSASHLVRVCRFAPGYKMKHLDVYIHIYAYGLLH